MNSSEMTTEELQAFHDREGYWPTRYVPRVVTAKDLARQQAKKLQSALRTGFLANWRRPLHWTEPPLFDNPGRMYEQLGHEEFTRQVTEYYEAIRRLHCQRASKEHTRWAIKQILRMFETQVRGFRGQEVSAKGKIFGKSSGQEKWGRSRSPKYQDILVLPETLAEHGRFSQEELEGYLRAYAIPMEEQRAVARLIRLKLEALWGVQL